MDATLFIMNIFGAVAVVNIITFPSLNQHLHLVVNGGTLGDFVLKEKDVTRRQNESWKHS